MEFTAKIFLLDYSHFLSKSGRSYCSLAFKSERGLQFFRCSSEVDFSSCFSGPGLYHLAFRYILFKDSGFFVLTGIEHIK